MKEINFKFSKTAAKKVVALALAATVALGAVDLVGAASNESTKIAAAQTKNPTTTTQTKKPPTTTQTKKPTTTAAKVVVKSLSNVKYNKSASKKITIKAGETIKTSKVTFTAKMSNGQSKTVKGNAKGVKVSYNNLKGGKITVTYGGKKATSKKSLVAIKKGYKIKSVKLAKKPAKVKKGKAISEKSISVKVTYTNKKAKTYKLSAVKGGTVNAGKKVTAKKGKKVTIKVKAFGKTLKFKAKVK